MRNNNAAESDISHVSAFTGQRLTQRTCGNCSPRFLDNDDNLDFLKILFVQLRTLKGKALHHTCVFIVGYTRSVTSDTSFKEARQHRWYDYSQEQRLCSPTHISKFTSSNSRNFNHLFNQSRINFILNFYRGYLWTSASRCINWNCICRGGMFPPGDVKQLKQWTCLV